ncbi:MAG: hypothetical protein IPK04_16740 [Bdellovibrionales bacterium]|jgi:hypothetical protein|nr:hypothetical protein [Bdellovibrionales bacterium]
MYTKKNIDAYFYTTKGFYLFHIPVKVPYKLLYGMADAADHEMEIAGDPSRSIEILKEVTLATSKWLSAPQERM